MSRWLLVAACLLALPAMAPGGAGAASFVLEGGEVVEGRLVAATRNTLTVRPKIGGIRQIPVKRLAEVKVRNGGATLTGRVVKVEGGKLVLATADGGRLWVEGDRVVAEDRPSTEPVRVSEVSPLEPRADAPGDAANAGAAAPGPVGAETGLAAEGSPSTAEESPSSPGSALLADLGPRPPVRGLAPGRSFGGLLPPAAAAATAPEAAAKAEIAPDPDVPLIRIKVASPEIGEQDGKAAFLLELSRASDQPIHLVYSTVDGQAVAGQDYEARQGVAILAPGETSYAIEAKVLDDPDDEDPEHFFLFVTTDAKQAALEEKWHRITIQDDD